MGKIAIVEDDKEIARLEQLSLEKDGYAIQLYPNGTSFLASLESEIPDLVILDLMLPDIQGLDLLKKLRSLPSASETDVIIVSAKGLVSDKVEGLDLGADDYLEKPFSVLELSSRVKARFRKKGKPANVISFGRFTLDEKRHVVLDQDQKEVPLTKTEWDLLLFLLRHANEAVSRETLFASLWGQGDYESRTLDVHILSLRKKLGDSEAKLIETVYGFGYRFIV